MKPLLMKTWKRDRYGVAMRFTKWCVYLRKGNKETTPFSIHQDDYPFLQIGETVFSRY